LNAHEKQIDKTLLEIQAKLKESVVFYGKQAIDSLKKLVSDNVFKVGKDKGAYSICAHCFI
jgi:hypothetical protein